MKKKVLKVLAFVTAIILILILGTFVNGLVGNPVSKMFATNTAKRHLAKNYPNTDYYLEKVTFDFKDTSYYAYFKSPGSVDGDFALNISMGGELIWDNYEECVLGGQNTANRLYEEYRTLVDSVLESPSFPYKNKGDIHFGDLQFVSKEEVGTTDVPSYALITEELKLDGVYDIRELGKQAGLLVFYVEDDTVNVERAAEILLEVKNWMDDGGVPFYAIDFVLEYPLPEDGSGRKDERVELMEFLFEDIYEEGMVERVREANEATNAYYEGMDGKEPEISVEIEE